MSKPEWVYTEILIRLKRPQIYAFRGIALEEQVETLFGVNTCGVWREFDRARPDYIEKVFGVKCSEDYSLYNHELYRGVGYIEELLPENLTRIEKLNLTAEHLRNIYEKFALEELERKQCLSL